MCSVWVHGPGACVSFAVANFLVLATEELDCRRGLQRLPTELDARCVLRGSGQQRASRKARDLFRAGNRNCAWAYRQASRCDRVDFQGTKVRDACCQSCKAAGVNGLLSQDLEFVLG